MDFPTFNVPQRSVLPIAASAGWCQFPAMKLMASELFALAHQQGVARDCERAIAHLQRPRWL